MSTTIYHNPRCSKSRKSLELLQERGQQATVIEYLKTPPSREELKKLLRLLGIGPRDLLRQGEAEYQELKLDDMSLDDESLIDAMLAHPKLIERPIVVHDGKAVIGRPPERILDILA